MIYRFSLPVVFFVVSFFSLNAQQLTFEGDTASTNDQLGFDVAMTENFAVSAAWQKNVWFQGELKEEAGCVYLHKKEKGEWVYQERITYPEPRKDDSFGRSIAISEDYLVVGAASRNPLSKKDGRYNREGAVFIYHRNGDSYVFKHELKCERLQGDILFGEKVTVGGDYMAVACNYPIDRPDGKKSNGAVLVYKLSHESEPQQIATLISEGSTSAFDYAVKIHGNKLLVAEENQRVSLYELKGESVDIKQEIFPEEGFESDFGHDVAASDDYIVVGASGGDYDFYGVEFDSSIDSLYSLMMIDDETGRFAMKYIQNNKADMEKYGVSSEVFKKGAKPYETWEEYSARKGGAGAVYVYKKEKDGYKLSQTLMASDRKADDNFGMRVEIEGDLIVVGAFGKASSQGGKDEDRFAGAAYAFKLNKGKWKEVKKYQEQNPKGWDKFGFSVACSKDEIMIGCRFKDVEKDGALTEDAGTVYFYKKP
ncbi:FG-GAP repeat protein [Owenweeksia hongkongensis]|uniref:FG-GAP repeat protein n=1 Tax=Owenweeksia hongkongensis TaxID=253245 RepID=UPI003A8FAFD8